MDDMTDDLTGYEHRSWIHRIFHDPNYYYFILWHQVVNFFIYLSCLMIALESIEEWDSLYHREFMLIEWVSVIFFTFDYLGNVYTARDRLKYITSFWGMVDLLSILPSYLMIFNFTGVKATKILRILRVIRVLRVLKLARSAMRDVNDSKAGTTNPIVANLRIYFIALFSIMMISSTLIYYVEGGLYTTEAMTEGQAHLDATLVKDGKEAGSEKFMPVDPISGNSIPEDKRVFTSIPTAMWWCIVTLTTTGYGDLYPVTVGGRVIAGVTMLLGLVLFGILMNIIGRTLMVVLFGETLDDKEKAFVPATAEEARMAAIQSLAAHGVLNHEAATRLSSLSSLELTARLTGQPLT
jgi:voltage-gated potassium channel